MPRNNQNQQNQGGGGAKVEAVGTRVATGIAGWMSRKAVSGHFELPKNAREWADEAFSALPFMLRGLLPFGDVVGEAVQEALSGLVERVQRERGAHPDPNDKGWIDTAIDETLSPLLKKRGSASKEIDGMAAIAATSNEDQASFREIIQRLPDDAARQAFIKRVAAVKLDPGALKTALGIDDPMMSRFAFEELLTKAEAAKVKADRPAGEVVGENLQGLFKALGFSGTTSTTPATPATGWETLAPDDKNRRMRAALNPKRRSGVSGPGLFTRLLGVVVTNWRATLIIIVVLLLVAMMVRACWGSQFTPTYIRA